MFGAVTDQGELSAQNVVSGGSFPRSPPYWCPVPCYCVHCLALPTHLMAGFGCACTCMTETQTLGGRNGGGRKEKREGDGGKGVRCREEGG